MVEEIKELSPELQPRFLIDLETLIYREISVYKPWPVERSTVGVPKLPICLVFKTVRIEKLVDRVEVEASIAGLIRSGKVGGVVRKVHARIVVAGDNENWKA